MELTTMRRAFGGGFGSVAVGLELSAHYNYEQLKWRCEVAPIGEEQGWDAIEEQQTFQEQIGPQDSELSGDMAARPVEDMEMGSEMEPSDRLSMPAEVLDMGDQATFGERLPGQDESTAADTMTNDTDEDAAFEQAARDQLEDEK